MKKVLYFILFFLLPGTITLYGQVGINNTGNAPNPSAGLDVSYTDKGFLPPRMSVAERNAIPSPAKGLVIYNTECNDLNIFNGATWVPVGNGGMLPAPGSISGTASPCGGSSGEVYSISPVSGATGYNWSVPPGAVITSGQGTPSVIVHIGNSGGGICVAAHNDCGKSAGSCLSIALTPPPAAPAEGVHSASQSVVTWNWQPVQGATGYKWNFVDNVATATDLGLATSYLEAGLECNQLYTRYVWAYIDCGNSPSTILAQKTAECPATCPGVPTVSYEGKTYNTVQIGSQCWLAKNLDVGDRIDGIVSQTNNGFLEKYCYYDLESNCVTYGGLYQWNELMQYITTPGTQGICPPDWHIPTNSEWAVLCSYLGGEGVAGGSLKEAGTLHWLPPNSGATNSSGFTGLPSGRCNYDGTFTNVTRYAYFWTSSQADANNAWYRDLDYGYEGVSSYSYDKVTAYSVRCLKN